MGDAGEGGIVLSTAFRRGRGGSVTATFHRVEVDLLRSLVGQLVELVRDEQPVAQVHADPDDPLAELLQLASPERPRDPVLLRLFPDAYESDDEGAADFRRYTERGLREAKTRNAGMVLAGLDAAEGKGDRLRVRLDPPQAEAWLRCLTDLRLALGTRLGVEQDDADVWAVLDEDDPRRYVHGIYEWLGYVQETLVHAMSPGRR